MNTDKKSGNNIATVLRSFRIAREMSVKQLAEKMDVRSSYISAVEHGTRNPSRDTFEKYSVALNVPRSVLEFFNEEADEHSYNFRKLLISILQYVEKLDNNEEDEVISLISTKKKTTLN